MLMGGGAGLFWPYLSHLRSDLWEVGYNLASNDLLYQSAVEFLGGGK